MDYDVSGTNNLTGGNLYESNGTVYYAGRDFDTTYNHDLAQLSGWDYNASRVSIITISFVDASAFSAEGNKCPDLIEKGTLYYDADNNKLWSARYDNQRYRTRPDINPHNWDDVSGLLNS